MSIQLASIFSKTGFWSRFWRGPIESLGKNGSSGTIFRTWFDIVRYQEFSENFVYKVLYIISLNYLWLPRSYTLGKSFGYSSSILLFIGEFRPNLLKMSTTT